MWQSPPLALALSFLLASTLLRRGLLQLFILPLTVVLLPFFALSLVGRSPAVTEARVRGFDLRLDPREFVDYVLLHYPRLFDARELAFMERRLRAGDTFVDVGANVGYYTLVASRAVGDTGTVVAVEADPVTFERLRGHLERNRARNVRAVRVGAGDRRGMLQFGILRPPFRAASGFLAGAPATAIEVPTEPLLDIVRGAGVAAIRGMKLDIEGYEYVVLSRFLADAPPELLPEFVIVEFYPQHVTKAGGDVLALLKRHGYRVLERNTVNYTLDRPSAP